MGAWRSAFEGGCTATSSSRIIFRWFDSVSRRTGGEFRKWTGSYGMSFIDRSRPSGGIIIRAEEPPDRAGISSLHRQAFRGGIEADIVEALRAVGAVALSLVAAEDGSILGHLLFSPGRLESGDQVYDCLVLGPLAVLHEKQRHGIGATLVRAGLDELGHRSCPAVFVLGHPEYYPRFGFAPAEIYGIRPEINAPAPAFMALELQKGWLLGRPGVLRFRPEFLADRRPAKSRTSRRRASPPGCLPGRGPSDPIDIIAPPSKEPPRPLGRGRGGRGSDAAKE